MTVQLHMIPREEFVRVARAPVDSYAQLELLADMCRINTLTIVKRAGSGHLGSSFSAMEIVIWLYYREMNTLQAGLTDPGRDIYFSSKGHDVPGLYAVLYSLGVIPRERVLQLRRLGGLDGHPDIGVPGIEANSGSLGMGISKGRGMAWAKRLLAQQGHVFVMTGDGELQEGQIFEALQTAAHHRLENLTVIVDHNKVQSDRPVAEIVDLGDLEAKFRTFGWFVARCHGHDFQSIQSAVERSRTAPGPAAIIADTIKGRGVSFMEHPEALRAGRGLYPWHAGAPDDETFTRAHAELTARVRERFIQLGLATLRVEPIDPEHRAAAPATLFGEPISQAAETRLRERAGVSDEYVGRAFGEALVDLAEEQPDLVVLDADLASDCRLRGFETRYPERFIENGIAEQDMVSTAGGLARLGLLPVVNSFASFLASRANEQIYNNATERTKIIYACHYAGLIPAGPGKSHQSIRDISLFGALPNVVILQPCNAWESRQIARYCVLDAAEPCMIRLAIGPSPRRIELPAEYRLEPGRGAPLTDGADAMLFAYGPVMLHEALLAADLLAERGVGLRVMNMPWLNRCDRTWLGTMVGPYTTIYVLEDHAPVGGLADHLVSILGGDASLSARRVVKFAVEGYPACGTPEQVLRFHGLDAVSLAERILRDRSGDARSTSSGPR